MSDFSSYGFGIRRCLAVLKSVLFIPGLLVATSLVVHADDLITPGFRAVPTETNTPEMKQIDSENSLPASILEADKASSPVPTNLDSNATPIDKEGNLPMPDTDSAAPSAKVPDQAHEFQTQLELARQQRHDKGSALAIRTLVALLQTNAPGELKRPVLFELALAEQDDNQALKAQQVYAQYLHNYPDDPTVPEVLLRQGLLYRQMGVNTLAVSKFYSVMSSALKLKLGSVDYYKKLVLQAQVEIADTYYLEGKYNESSDFFARLLKAESPGLNKPQVQFKLIRSLSCLTNHAETIARAQTFLEVTPASSEVPEVRFLLASALKKIGRNQDSMKQVLLLLQSQQENVKNNPETWIYWQRRAGNEIANQLYKEGDYLNALEIYLSLANLDKSIAWQLPVWYQTALVYEQLQQWSKATETYNLMLNRQKELTPADTTPSLASLFEMAKWRKDYIDWTEKAKMTNQSFQRAAGNPPPITPQ